MYLRIDENDFGGYYYDRILTVNGVEKRFKEKEFELSFEEEFEEEELEVVVRFRNSFLSNENKRRWLHILLRLLDRMIWGGCSLEEERTRNRPYDAVLEFSCKKNARIELYTNSLTMERPFTFYGTSPNVSKNVFYAEAGYKKRWLLIHVMPKGVLFGLLQLFFLFILLSTHTGGKIISSIFIGGLLLGAMAYFDYVRKLLRRH